MGVLLCFIKFFKITHGLYFHPNVKCGAYIIRTYTQIHIWELRNSPPVPALHYHRSITPVILVKHISF